MEQNRTWVVVADGAQARILLHTERTDGLKQVPNGEFNSHHLPTHNKPHEAVGNERHVTEGSRDPHVQKEHQFLSRLAEYIEVAAQRGEFEHVVIVAPATAMGEIRRQNGQHTKQRLHKEVVHDYAHQSIDFIYKHIKDSLPL